MKPTEFGIGEQIGNVCEFLMPSNSFGPALPWEQDTLLVTVEGQGAADLSNQSIMNHLVQARLIQPHHSEVKGHYWANTTNFFERYLHLNDGQSVSPALKDYVGQVQVQTRRRYADETQGWTLATFRVNACSLQKTSFKVGNFPPTITAAQVRFIVSYYVDCGQVRQDPNDRSTWWITSKNDESTIPHYIAVDRLCQSEPFV